MHAWPFQLLAASNPASYMLLWAFEPCPREFADRFNKHLVLYVLRVLPLHASRWPFVHEIVNQLMARGLTNLRNSFRNYTYSTELNRHPKPRLGAMDVLSTGVSEVNLTASVPRRSTKRNMDCRRNSCISQLEQDVQRLELLLRDEMEVHLFLENALEQAAVNVSDLSSLPDKTRKLLNDIATLEATVLRLEEKMISLHFQLIQERNERRLAEYHLKKLPLQSDFTRIPKSITSQDKDGGLLTADGKDPLEQNLSPVSERLTRQIAVKDLWNFPNILSEEMVRCMKNIFITLVDSSTASLGSAKWASPKPSATPSTHFSVLSSLLSSAEQSKSSPQIQSPQLEFLYNTEVLTSESAFDLYEARDKLCWMDIGNYGLAKEVSWMSVKKQQLDFAAGALSRFSFLIEQLAKVNPIHLNGNEKLAFWINIYNALIMHAYLAYGVPRSGLKLLSLMQKAVYTVAGQSFSAACIEYMMLNMKVPIHRPQTGLLLSIQRMKVSEEQKDFAIEKPEPLVAFALSCGMYSSPAVKIYSPGNVHEELLEAQRDFIRASVGISNKGKLLVPKMLQAFAKGLTNDIVVWLAGFLPQQQAMIVEQCVSRRQQSFLSSRSFGVIPFDSRFRYLFLPEVDEIISDASFYVSANRRS